MTPHPRCFGLFLPRRIFVLLLGQTARQITVFSIAVVLIYLSDKILTMLLADTLRHGLGLLFLAETTAAAAPEILMLGLPPALFFSVLIVLAHNREARLFLVLQSAGSPPAAVACFLLTAGIIGGLAGGAVSGWLQPYASYRLSTLLFEGAVQAVTHAPEAGTAFTSLATLSLIHPEKSSAGDAGLLAVLDNGDGTFNLITATRGNFLLKEAEGTVQSALETAHIDQISAKAPDGKVVLNYSMRLDRMTVSNSSEGLRAPVQGTGPETRTFSELTHAFWQGNHGAIPRAEFFVRLLRSILLFLTPLAAGAAFGFGSNRAEAVAIAIAATCVLAAGFLVTPLAGALAALDGRMAIAGVAAVGCLATAILFIFTARMAEGWIRPRGLAG